MRKATRRRSRVAADRGSRSPNAPRRAWLSRHGGHHAKSLRGSDVFEDPIGHLRSLLPTCYVSETEMNALVDAHIDHIGLHVREAVIGAFLRPGGSGCLYVVRL